MKKNIIFLKFNIYFSLLPLIVIIKWLIIWCEKIATHIHLFALFIISRCKSCSTNFLQKIISLTYKKKHCLICCKKTRQFTDVKFLFVLFSNLFLYLKLIFFEKWYKRRETIHHVDTLTVTWEISLLPHLSCELCLTLLKGKVPLLLIPCQKCFTLFKILYEKKGDSLEERTNDTLGVWNIFTYCVPICFFQFFSSFSSKKNVCPSHLFNFSMPLKTGNNLQ